MVYSFIVECFVLRGFSLRRDFARVVLECTTVVGGVLMIIGVAKGLTGYLGLQDAIAELETDSPAVIYDGRRRVQTGALRESCGYVLHPCRCCNTIVE